MLSKRFKKHDLSSGRWINPFILKLNSHSDSIISPQPEDFEQIRERLILATANFQEVYLELCAGSGTHLLALAKNNPGAFIIGVELRFKRIVRTAEKAKEQSLNNILLLQFNAEFIEELIPQNFLNRIYINFPDPWDSKLRWNDRFLLSVQYLKKLTALLKTGSTFAFKTDHKTRFNQVLSALQTAESPMRITEHSENLHSSEFKMQNIFTEFERLFTQQKKPVFYLKAQK